MSHLEKSFNWPCYALTRSVSKKISSKILLNTKNPLPQLAKNPISKSSAKMTKSALVRQTRKSTFRNTSTNPLPKNQKSLTDTSERRILPSSEKRNTIVVLFARNADILPAITQISQPSLFVSFSTYSNLPSFLTTKMLNPSSQSSPRKMIIQPSFLLTQQIQIQMTFLWSPLFKRLTEFYKRIGLVYPLPLNFPL